MKKMLTTVVIVLIIGYGALLLFTYLRQDGLLYYPMKRIEATPADIGLDYEDVVLETTDGLKISAWYIPREGARGTVLFCHGNAGNISHRLDSIRIFHRLGLSVLIFDYRGYGRSEGKPSEQGTYRDAEAGWTYLVQQRSVPPERMILFGRSLGSAVAAEIALRHRAGALIVESGFTSVADLGQRYFPYLPVRLLTRHRYETIEKVGWITIPKLFIHSTGDEIVPFQQGMALYEKASEPKEFLRIAGGHNEGFLISGSLYTEGLDRFISRHVD